MIAFDRSLFLLIHQTSRNALFDLVMPQLTEKWNWVLPLAAVFLLYAFFNGTKRGALLFLSGVLLVLVADAGATALKHVFLRPRPLASVAEAQALAERAASSSFPSNHAVNAFALATLFAIYYPSLAIPFFTVAALVGYSRVYLGDHYPLDVLAGAVFGAALGLAAGWASLWVGRRWHMLGHEGRGRRAASDA
ncbi:MAG TPA: phosphatase PAP2 family protein [Candidatus Sulfotelmatobacter sp.]|nr:phosphatase PAP2 family protein [Candidatus Sulfotelmatobacter sp.]